MDINSFKNKTKKVLPNHRSPQKPKDGKSLFKNILTVVILFLVISVLYSVMTSGVVAKNSITISDLAKSINDGSVKSIVVTGNALAIEYSNGDKKIAQKEDGTALTQTLTNYKVPVEKIAGVKIEVKDSGDSSYWMLILSSVLLPVIFIGFLIWFLSRQ